MEGITNLHVQLRLQWDATANIFKNIACVVTWLQWPDTSARHKVQALEAHEIFYSERSIVVWCIQTCQVSQIRRSGANDRSLMITKCTCAVKTGTLQRTLITNFKRTITVVLDYYSRFRLSGWLLCNIWKVAVLLGTQQRTYDKHSMCGDPTIVTWH